MGRNRLCKSAEEGGAAYCIRKAVSILIEMQLKSNCGHRRALRRSRCRSLLLLGESSENVEDRTFFGNLGKKFGPPQIFWDRRHAAANTMTSAQGSRSPYNVTA